MEHSKFYNRRDQGCHFVSTIIPGMYSVYTADGNFLCITDMEGAVNICEYIEIITT